MAISAEAIASFLLTYALHSTLLIAVVWTWMRIRAPRSARTREALWSLALVGGILSALAQGSGLLAPRTWTVDLAEVRTTADRAEVCAAEESPLVDGAAAPYTPQCAVVPTTAPTNAGIVASTALRVRAAIDALLRLTLGSTATLAWIIGALAVLAVLFTRTALWRLVRLPRREPVDGAPAAALARLVASAGLKRTVRLTRSDRLSVPVAFGLLHPEICVPARSLAELDPMQQDAMLAHELAHLVRRDPLRLLVARIVECVFFFQPLNRLARKRMFEEVEFRCDALAVRLTGQGLSLASCLAQVAEWMRGGSTRACPVTTAMAPMSKSPSALVRRIERLLDDADLDHDERGGRLAYALPAALFVVLMCAAPAIATTPRELTREPIVFDPMPSAFAQDAAEGGSELANALHAANTALEIELTALRDELALLAAEKAAGDADPAVTSVLTKLQDRLETLDRCRRTLMADIDRLAADEGLDPQARTLPAVGPRRNAR